ncbi:MAG: hypothetical protein KDE48_22765 [Anaerolineales bacterium]|nr:hypothetical protein [Anaerolineales bacterium]
MKYEIHSLGYDVESDELDLLINYAAPQPGYAIDIGNGVLVRRHMETDQIVGAIIRGYKRFAEAVRHNKPFHWQLAHEENLEDVIQAIVTWQSDIDNLSQTLAHKLGANQLQYSLVETLLALPMAS